ncbi:hypothetical protein SAMN05660860_03090 [Geoalkalibacter ferrihydriticus]|uniref:Lipid A 3-O-deacylase n=2 Tax=Geoalkalibacter ferrihydriticus TaxID=392333 RepID=A0A0C2EAV1_9BACT|nr:hypothetical protein [Geoalkalibacter ferrihydriticus]KIH75693.1 hypothetical protein GFER_15330 [Geoalkalibacter ferrihydriticus DSM 17813]SDM74010.1 hypothetical protein SAMN05660860_03090 [Geoalkalibacter ferrihydriticus]
MRVFFWNFLLAAILTLSVLPAGAAAAQKEYPWSLVGYGAVYTPDRLKDIFFNRHSYEDSYLAALAINREFARTGPSLAWEGEGQLVKHFGRQEHWEYNALVVARWHRFPWNHRVATSLAVGEGISWATRKPKLEIRDDRNVSQLLNYLLFELTLAKPQSRWYWSGRIHHRSGVFGLYNGVRGGSNFVGMGTGYRF